MGTDTIKIVYTYSIATLVIVGGIVFLYFSRNDPSESNTAALIPLISGFVGAAIQFVFNRETQTSTARQVERSVAAGSKSTAEATLAAAAAPTQSVNAPAAETVNVSSNGGTP
jgi:hypothetical protein